MSQNQVLISESTKVDQNSRIQMATYIADLLKELGGLARRTQISELEKILSEASEQASKIAKQK